MKNLNRSYYNPPFSHIYVEREVAEDPETKRMLAQFPQAEVIDIDHYKDVFCRSRQDYVRQHAAQNLILAAKHGERFIRARRSARALEMNIFTIPPV